MSETVRRIIQSRCGGKVERCHGIPHTTSYSNAAHSWGVAMLLHYIYPDDFPRLVLTCLSHDVPEGWVGDIPAPSMRYVPGLRGQLGPIEGGINRSLGLPGEDELSPEDHAKLKVCDHLEFYLWCRDQIDMGNSFAYEAMHEVVNYIDNSVLPDPAGEIWEDLKKTSVLPKQAGVMFNVTRETASDDSE